MGFFFLSRLEIAKIVSTIFVSRSVLGNKLHGTCPDRLSSPHLIFSWLGCQIVLLPPEPLAHIFGGCYHQIYYLFKAYQGHMRGIQEYIIKWSLLFCKQNNKSYEENRIEREILSCLQAYTITFPFNFLGILHSIFTQG